MWYIETYVMQYILPYTDWLHSADYLRFEDILNSICFVLVFVNCLLWFIDLRNFHTFDKLNLMTG